MRAQVCEFFYKIKPYIAMVVLQFGYAGMFVVSVASLKRGMSHYVLVVYRNVVATIFMAPFAFWFERKVRPKMTLSCFLKIMLLALLEPVLDQNFYYVGAKLTSASFSAALYNMLPAMTFLLAALLRMENLKMRSWHTRAKIAGTLITVAGALVMILYKGPVVDFFWTKGRPHHGGDDQQVGGEFLKGTFMLIFSCFCWSAFFIVQSHTLRSYPAEMSLTTWICLLGAIQSAAVTLTVERGIQPWIIGWDMRLVTAVYSGIMCSGVAYYVQGIVMKERGPVFVTAFNPLCMIIVAVLGSILLAEDINLGRVIGAVIIVAGLYSLIWGKSKDHLVQTDTAAAAAKAKALELPVSAADVDNNKHVVGGDESYGPVVHVVHAPAKN